MPLAKIRVLGGRYRTTILPLLTSGQVNPIVERTYRLGEAAEALRHLIPSSLWGSPCAVKG